MAIDKPYVSVIIPAFNEEDHVGQCLETLLQIDYPKDRFEVIVVDNGSKDQTMKIVKRFPVKLFCKPGVRVGAVRNYGVAQATGSILAFVDADCLVTPKWLSAGVEKLNEAKVGAVGGVCKLPKDPSWVEECWVLSPSPEDRYTHSLAGGSIICKRDAFEGVGGFDEQMNAGEDTNLAEKLIRKGWDLLMLKNCAVIHLGWPKTLRVFMRRQCWHGSSAFTSRSIFNLEKVSYVTVAFIVFALASPVLLLAKSSWWLLTASLWLSVPLIFTVRRVAKDELKQLDPLRLAKIYVLQLCYFLGRSWGFFISLFAKFGILKNKKTYY